MMPGRRAALAAMVGIALLAGGCYAAFDWREFAWPDGGFTVLLPGKPARDAREIAIGTRRLRMELLSVRVDDASFGVAWADLPTDIDAAGRARLVADARDGLLRNVGSAAPSEDRIVSLEGHVGREFRGDGTRDGRVLAVAGRVYATDRRFYQLVAIAPRDQMTKIDVPLFLGSLKLVK